MSDSPWWCKHYNGVALNKTCKIGVLYQDVFVSENERRDYPCTNRNIDTCPGRLHLTEEEWAAHEKAVSDAVNKFLDFKARKTDVCFHCGRQVKRLRKVGRCVYAEPCGCRMWQGGIPGVWKGPKFT